MKRFLTLSLFFIGLSVALAQVTPFEPQVDWDDPTFPQQQVKKHNIKAIRISTFELGGRSTNGAYQAGVSYHYGQDGNLLRQVETDHSQEDTTQVHQYEYSTRGVLCWQTTEDKRWKRTYRSGYRFTGSGAPYQVKSYELLRNDERMLLKSRQYIYADDSILSAIRLLENHRVVRVHRFQYVADFPGLVSREIIENGDGELIKQVTYAYDSLNLIAHVVMTEANGDRSEYRYAYNGQNQPKRIEWWQGENLIGLVLYEYNELGLVAHLNQTLYPNTPQQHSRYKVFEYETYPAATAYPTAASPLD